MTLVSVVIPCYKHATYIRSAISSLQEQTHVSWEAIIVDDGSPDDIADVAYDICRDDNRVKFVQKSNGGLSSARNYGMKFTNGDYLLFLDADDSIAPHALEVLVKKAEEEELDVVFGGHLRFFDNPCRNWTDGAPALVTNDLRKTLIRQNHYPVHAVLIKATFALEIGKFDEGLTACEDWDYWLRASHFHKKFGFVYQIVAFYRCTPDSMSSCKGRMLQNRVKVFNKFVKSFGCEVVHDSEIVNEIVSTSKRLYQRLLVSNELRERDGLLHDLESILLFYSNRLAGSTFSSLFFCFLIKRFGLFGRSIFYVLLRFGSRERLLWLKSDYY